MNVLGQKSKNLYSTKIFFKLVVLAYMASNCGSSQFNMSDSSHLNNIVGNNDLEKVSSSDRSTFFALGQIDSGCTVSHLGNGFVLTAGHCLGAPTEGAVYSEKCLNKNINITWGRIKDFPDGNLTSQCTSILLREFNSQYDYAVMRVSPAPKFSINPDFDSAPSKGEEVLVFSYPLGRTLEWSGPCKILGVESNQTKLYHSCDTQAGSSGAPILNQNSEVIGIHTTGYQNHNGGIAIRNTAIEEFF